MRDICRYLFTRAVWDHFWVTVASLWDHCGVGLASLSGKFGICLGPLLGGPAIKGESRLHPF